MSSESRIGDTPTHEYVLELLREREALLKNVKHNCERGVMTFDEYLSCSCAVIKEIGELRALLRDAIFE
jgi:hypothetical protein